VSRVINGDKLVKDKTRQKVQLAVDQLKYVPNLAARSLASADTVRVALLYSNTNSSYLSEFLVGMLDEVQDKNIQLVVEKAQSEQDQLPAIRRVIEARVDGVVVPPPLCDSEDLIKTFQNAGLSVVAAGLSSSPVSSVSIDDFRAAYDMTMHIRNLGHVRIGFIRGNNNHAASFARFDGYKTALQRVGIEVDDELIQQGLFTYASGLVAARNLLSLKNPPTAIFASNDEMASAAVAIAHQHGLDVPRDLTICGFDDSLLATTIWPNLTTIRQPISKIAQASVEILAREIKLKRQGNEIEYQHPIIDYKLIKRASEAPVKISV
jgi:LacI family transcriptional regulator